jgi:transposase
MGRAKNGKAISEARRSRPERRRLTRFLTEGQAKKDLAAWRRAKAVVDYIGGKSVIAISEALCVTRGSVNRWLQWFEARGTEGLKTRKPSGVVARLSEVQYEKLSTLIETGPQAAGFATGIWTGPMVGELIRRQFQVNYHNHYIPEILHKLGFSVQRPRRRLAKADLAKQEIWLKQTFPKIKKKRRHVEERFYLGMKRASGSMGLSIRLGQELDISRESIPTGSERQHISMVQ